MIFHLSRLLSFFLKTCRFIFLVFGFISCGPEPSNPSKQEIKGVSFSHLNLSTHQINETKIIDITSFIVLDLQDPVKLENHSLIESTCSNSYLKDFSGFSKIENSTKLPIRDILPPEAFTPTSNPHLELYCNFKIEVFSKNQKVAIILLNDIRITGIEKYSNFPLPMKESDKDPEIAYIQKDMEKIKLSMPLDKGELLTLCENSGEIHLFDGKTLPMAGFFSQELFEEKSLTLCRLLVSQKKSSKTWVSKPFYVQGQEPQITYQYQHNYTAKKLDENHWIKENMGVLNIFNQGPTVIYLQIPGFSTKVSVAGVYSYQNSNVNYKSKTLDLNVWWAVDKGVLIKKGDDKNPDVYKLEPGLSISLSLNTMTVLNAILKNTLLLIENTRQFLP